MAIMGVASSQCSIVFHLYKQASLIPRAGIWPDPHGDLVPHVVLEPV